MEYEENIHRTCYCHTCDKWFHPLGIMSHRASHRRRQQSCKITMTHGDTYTWRYDKITPMPTTEVAV